MNDATVQRIRDNLQSVKDRIARAAERANRDPSGISLVAVTKGHTAEEIMALYDCGVRVFGENRIQEALQKIPSLPDDVDWHLIGHLQRNKAKFAVRQFALIHSLDSIRLGNELQKQCERFNAEVTVLLEVNVSGEESKYGLSAIDMPEMLSRSRDWTRLKVIGLMTMAPFVDEAEDVRPVFRRLRELRDSMHETPGGERLDHLSMGMTNDFEVAVEEGATMVRIGSALFQS